jgi:AmiR/NasT family two-component response regulator
MLQSTIHASPAPGRPDPCLGTRVTRIVVLSSDPSGCGPLLAGLDAAGCELQAVVPCNRLLQQVLLTPPDVVVAWQPQPDPALVDTVAQLQAHAPAPVLVFTNEVQLEACERALQAGVSAWVVQGYAPQRLRPLLQQARVRFRQEQAAREALADLHRRYEERTLVDRAKGVLMRARGLDEESAFRLLRQASMKAKLRLGQVAQQVVDISRDADAVNRAGQLRMLSQRLVKCHALRLAGVDSREAAALQQQSLERAAALLSTLQRSLSVPTFGDLLDAAQLGFASLCEALEHPLSAAALRITDAAAERWLQQADRLVRALQGAGHAAPLHVVNLAGRQRMLSQRIAKEALLGALLDEPGAAQALTEARQEFEAALQQLRALPLATPEILQLQAEAEAAWAELAAVLERAGDSGAQLVIARRSEALLALFEALTQRYEHGMQRLAGEAIAARSMES